MTREEAIFYIKELQKTYASMDKKLAEAVGMAIEALSEERTGKWIEDGYYDYPYYVCSNCGQECGVQNNGVEIEPLRTKYCPNCGAKMGE